MRREGLYLTREEEKILAGEDGAPAQKAMEILVALGDIYEAERMIDVKSAHVSSVSFKGSGMAGMRFIENLAMDGATFKVPTSLNPLSIDIEKWKDLGFEEQIVNNQFRMIKAYESMGGISLFSCTPQLLGAAPIFREHIAWAESSALNYANSVIGARTNREGGISALASGIVGRTPLYGYHLDKNRIGQVLVNVEAELKTPSDYAALGYYTGQIVGEKNPVFKGIPKSVGAIELKSLSAALASSGAVALYHIVGITPEALTLEQALHKSQSEEQITFGKNELKRTYEKLSTATDEEVDYVAVGCPHYTVNEIQTVAQILKGKKVHNGVNLWIYTSPQVKVIASRMGLTEIIERAGGKIVCGNCMVLTYTEKFNFKNMATDSAKAAHYCPGFCKLNVHFGTLESCIGSAIAGKWRENK